MQAPATPSGPPVPEPGERLCPGCGASNGPLAAFCWQCYRQFGAAAGPPGSFPRPYARTPEAPTPPFRGLGYAPAPLPSPAPQPAPERGLPTKLGGLWVMVAVAIGSFAAFHAFSNGAPGVDLPDAIGALPRVESTQLDQAIEPFRDEAASHNVDTDMGFYGTAGLPSAALLWVDASDVTTEQDAWSDFAVGFNTGLGTGSLDETRRTSRVVESVTYDCAPIVGTPAGTVCLWEQDDVYWLLFDLSGSSLDTTQDLAVAAHDAAG